MGNIFEKLGTVISSETIGELDTPLDDVVKNTIEKKAPKKPPKEKPKKMVGKTFDKGVPEYTPKQPIDSILEKSTGQIDVSTKKGRYPVLTFLNIPFEPKLDNLVTPEDFDEVEFSLSSPTGVNPDEVEQFCDTLQRNVTEYRKIIKDRQSAFIMLLDHIEDLTQKLIEQKQESELASFIIERQTTEDRLKEQLVELRLENKELKDEILRLSRLTHAKAGNIEDTPKEPSLGMPKLDDIVSEPVAKEEPIEEKVTYKPIIPKKPQYPSDVEPFDMNEVFEEEDPFDLSIDFPML